MAIPLSKLSSNINQTSRSLQTLSMSHIRFAVLAALGDWAVWQPGYVQRPQPQRKSMWNWGYEVKPRGIFLLPALCYNDVEVQPDITG